MAAPGAARKHGSRGQNESCQFMSIATPSRSKADLPQSSPYREHRHRTGDYFVISTPRGQGDTPWGGEQYSSCGPRTGSPPPLGPRRGVGIAGPPRSTWEDSTGWFCPTDAPVPLAPQRLQPFPCVNAPSSSSWCKHRGGTDTPPPRWWLQGCNEATIDEPEAVWAGPEDANPFKVRGGVSRLDMDKMSAVAHRPFQLTQRHAAQVPFSDLPVASEHERPSDCCWIPLGDSRSKRGRECCIADAAHMLDDCWEDTKRTTPPQTPRVSTPRPLSRRRSP
jgi:hypothetical protein